MRKVYSKPQLSLTSFSLGDTLLNSVERPFNEEWLTNDNGSGGQSL